MPAEPLRLMLCGSVDDGKSTLIGRLVHDLGAIPEDVLSGLTGETGEVDLSRLTDGLAAEREQGITIDVAWRYFRSQRRTFIAADAPGHEQYTRNMATAASAVDVAVLLVDARKGLTDQTRRHAQISALLGLKTVILVVNKMDLVDWSRSVFDEIAAAFEALCQSLSISGQAVPATARTGANVVVRGETAAWWTGPTLLEILESLPDALSVAAEAPLRLAVQMVLRPGDERAYAGRISAGTLRSGDSVRVMPGGQTASVRQILSPDGPVDIAVAGQSVMVILAEDLDLGRGDVLCSATAPAICADQLEADIIWMAERPLLPGRPYWMKLATRTVSAQVTAIKSRRDIRFGMDLAADQVALNDIGRCNLSLGEPIALDGYGDNRTMGGFILIDRESRETVGAGLVRHALRRAANLHASPLSVSRETRAAALAQKPACLWFTGLSGAGKSTVANRLDLTLSQAGFRTMLLDGDNLRHGLNRDLGFTEADRVENIRRVAEVARLMTDAGLIVLVAFISPFRADRATARALFEPQEFVEIFVDAPLEVVESRDPKGLYRKARAGELPNFTGIDSPYEPPLEPDIHIHTDAATPDEACRHILDELKRLGRLG
ncbi:MAG: adenylyl-sulfate kinase [Caulobacterales bacterium]|nr:adenylyl-sulfate kinase [Caulobacterales bacterium]